jgi:hypothetical protein
MNCPKCSKNLSMLKYENYEYFDCTCGLEGKLYVDYHVYNIKLSKYIVGMDYCVDFGTKNIDVVYIFLRKIDDYDDVGKAILRLNHELPFDITDEKIENILLLS